MQKAPHGAFFLAVRVCSYQGMKAFMNDIGLPTL